MEVNADLSGYTAGKWFLRESGYRLGSDGGGPNHGSTLPSKRIRARMRGRSEQ